MYSADRLQSFFSAISEYDEDRAAELLSAIAEKYGIETGEDYYRNTCLILDTDTWYADDGHCECETSADNAADARDEYVSEGDWGSDPATSWVHVTAYRKGIGCDGGLHDVDFESGSVTIEPTEPDCESGEEHVWADVEGSLRGSGGGVTYSEVCLRCGCGRHVDTWAQDPTTGEQGLRSVTYRPDEYHIPELTIQDSLAAGHCRTETAATVREIRSRLGEWTRSITPVDLLKIRDDKYTRSLILNLMIQNES